MSNARRGPKTAPPTGSSVGRAGTEETEENDERGRNGVNAGDTVVKKMMFVPLRAFLWVLHSPNEILVGSPN